MTENTMKTYRESIILATQALKDGKTTEASQILQDALDSKTLYESAVLNWSGFSVQGDPESISEVKALLQDSWIVPMLRARIADLMKQVVLDPDYPCRSDGRCQYAIDSGAEGIGHCPKGKCVMNQ
jgi:hypothetical protein